MVSLAIQITTSDAARVIVHSAVSYAHYNKWDDAARVIVHSAVSYAYYNKWDDAARVIVHSAASYAYYNKWDDAAKSLVNCFVVSQVDNCNALLAVSPLATLNKIQRVLNPADKVIYGGKLECFYNVNCISCAELNGSPKSSVCWHTEHPWTRSVD